MNSAEIRQEIVVGVDPRGDWHPAVAWGADEARLRGLHLRLALSVPPRHDTQHVDDAPHHRRLEQDGRRTLEAAISWAHARWPETEITGSFLDGFPGRQLALLSLQVRLMVLGSRHLHRAEEILSSGSVVIPVTAQARCPVVVVGDPEGAVRIGPVSWSASTAASLPKPRWLWPSRKRISEAARCTP